MNIYDAAQTAALLPFPALADAVADALRRRASGSIHAPGRTHLPLPGGTLLVMPATDETVAVTKIVTVHPDNPVRSMDGPSSLADPLPTIQGQVAVIESATGRWLGLLDGPTLTARRTAAVSLLAARLLAPAPDGPLLVIGAGAQAEAHVRAFREGLKVEEVFILARAPERAMRLANLASRLGMSAQVAFDVAAALRRCPLVVTATTSPTPVIPDDPDILTPSRFIAAIGAYSPVKREIPEAVVRGSKLYCDTLEGAMAEAGEFLLAGIEESRVTPLEAVLDRTCVQKGPVLFKSVGHAIFDLAAAKLALKEGERRREGH